MTSGESTSVRTRPPWLHLVVSGLVGALLVGLAGAALMSFVFGGFIQAIIVVTALPFAFHAVNREFLDPCSGAWGLLTAVIWSPVVITSFLDFGASDEIRAGRPVTTVAAVAVPVVVASLSHPGWLRRVGLVISIASIAALGWKLMPDRESHEEALLREVGTTMRPYVTTVDGYTLIQEPGVVNRYLVEGPYRADGDVVTATDIMLVTESAAHDADPAVCGRRLIAIQPGDSAERETACAADGDSWVRTSRSRREVAQRRGHVLVRAVAAKRVPLGVLRSAVANSKPMDDEHFKTVYL